MIFFRMYNPFKAQTTSSKTKNTCYLCEPYQKKLKPHPNQTLSYNSKGCTSTGQILDLFSRDYRFKSYNIRVTKDLYNY